MRDQLFDAVLFDRDGTLVRDVPYNGEPALVRPVPGAAAALARLRAAGLRLGVVTNQSGLARGRFGAADLARVHDRIEQLLGRFDTWQVCPHAGTDGCGCRKPAPGLVLAAARALGTTPQRCVVVGDIGRDMVAAAAAGAAGILVPTAVTRPAEVAAAPAVAGDLVHAVDQILRRQRLVVAAACLVVCLNSDASVAARKGAGRPVMSQADRSRLLAALRCVDAVVVFDEPTPAAVLSWLRPDVWVKGGDYLDGGDRELPETGLLRRWGGQAVLVPYLDGRSTTNLITAAEVAGHRNGHRGGGAS